MLLKVRQIGDEFPIPTPIERDGLLTLTLDGAGVLVKVPENYIDRCERIVGSVSMSVFPVGVEVKLDPPNDALNGFWVQREIFEGVKKANGRSFTA